VKKPILTKRVVIGSVVVLLCATVGLFMRFPPGPRPLCQRLLDGAFQQWSVDNSHTNVYPNADGKGSASLAMIEPYFGNNIQEYAYVPGLHYDDSTDLVLMYLKKKTRHTWHGDTKHSIFAPSRWMVLSPGVSEGTCPEGGELVDTPELKRRLLLTLAFLKDKQRPYWQTVADEQMEFLNSIKE
jgi:hypothetical protein